KLFSSGFILRCRSLISLKGERLKNMVVYGELRSMLMQRALPYCVLLPPGYEMSDLSYPVLYLLHGLFGRFDDWILRTRIASHAARHDLIVVMPEGGDGWYCDSLTVETDRYESYLVGELIPVIESRYRTLRRRQGWAIAGLSMGGYGAFKFGLRH